MKRTMNFDVPRSVVEKAIDEWCFNNIVYKEGDRVLLHLK